MYYRTLFIFAEVYGSVIKFNATSFLRSTAVLQYQTQLIIEMEQEGDENEDVDDDGLINLVLLVAVVVAIVHRQRAMPVVQHYSIMTGNLYFREVLATNNVHRFSNVARMDIATFNFSFLCL